MKIQIKKNAYVHAGSSEMKTFLQLNEGNWIDVETDYLFNNQYNTETYRIYDSMVSAIQYDARINKGKCNYCGQMLDKGQECTKHKECKEYGINWFTPENTYFLKYPRGIKSMEHDREVLNIHNDCPVFGTYYLETYPSLDYYRLYNCRKTINFKYDKHSSEAFQVNNGIGFTATKRLDIPATAHEKLVKHLNSL